MKFVKLRPDEEPVLQIAPMIDIIFLLVIFFVTTSLLGEIEAEIDLTLPSASKTDLPQRAPGEIIINIKADNSIWVGGRERTVAEVEALVKELAAASERPSVIVRADKDSAHGAFVSVVDACRSAGVRYYKIPVLKREEPRP
ncbi:biopolymer transporter ExbD [bacterium]|nr:biopolymer transporter ExbD [bacterium]